MLTQTLARASITLNAATAALAWQNAFLAAGSEEGRPALYRTLSVEFFRTGVQLIGCDGTILIRTWIPTGESPTEFPVTSEIPDRAVVVMDVDQFAIAFIGKLAAATKDTMLELQIAIEPAPESEDAAPLGDVFASEILVLRAVGQQLHCRLFEGDFPNWRGAAYGIDRAEQVDGMRLATRMFATVGKLKGVHAVDCSFRGDERQIAFKAEGEIEVRGLLMPMRRGKHQTAEE